MGFELFGKPTGEVLVEGSRLRLFRSNIRKRVNEKDFRTYGVRIESLPAISLCRLH